MTTERTRAWRDAAVLAVVTLLAHGVVLTHRGLTWDDWPLAGWFARGRLDLVRWQFHELGAPIDFLIHRALFALPDPLLGYRVTALVAIAGGGAALSALLARTQLFTARERLAIACLAVVFPAGAAAASITVVPYVVKLALFWIGWWLVLSQRAVLGTYLIALSFFLKSLLVFHVVGLCALLATADGPPGARVRWLFRRHPHLVLLAPAFYLVTAWLFPAHGEYHFYNALWPSTHDVVSASAHSVANVLVELATAAGWAGAIVVVLGFAAGFAVPPEDVDRRQAGGMIAAGLGFAVLAIVPYALVGKPLALTGIDARNALLLPVPVGLVAIGVSRALPWPRVRLAIPVALIALLAASSLAAHLSWRAQAAHDLRVIRALAANPDGARYQIFLIDDRAPEGPARWRFHWEWAEILRRAYGGETRIGYDLARHDEAWVRGAVSHPPHDDRLRWDPAGCLARATITPAGVTISCVAGPCRCPR